MNKTDLIAAVAEATGATKTATAVHVDATLEAIAGALKKGETITLAGFGTFSVRRRAARAGRNPSTGQPIKIKASKTATFKAAKSLRDAM